MANNEIKLAAEARTEFGKGAARRIRRAHEIPAVMYGHGAAPVHITLPGHDTMMAVKTANYCRCSRRNQRQRPTVSRSPAMDTGHGGDGRYGRKLGVAVPVARHARRAATHPPAAPGCSLSEFPLLHFRAVP